jgi:hypothetical protein
MGRDATVPSPNTATASVVDFLNTGLFPTPPSVGYRPVFLVLCLLFQFVSAEGNDVVPLELVDGHHAEAVRFLKQMKMAKLFGMFT